MKMKHFRIFILVFAVLVSPAWAAQAKKEPTITVLAKSEISWNGQRLPEYPKGQPEVTILKVTVPPGASLPFHEHPMISAGIMTRGELTVETEDKKTLHLKAGDPIVEVVDAFHYGKNETDQPAEIVVFYAGIKNAPVSIKKYSDFPREDIE